MENEAIIRDPTGLCFPISESPINSVKKVQNGSWLFVFTFPILFNLLTAYNERAFKVILSIYEIIYIIHMKPRCQLKKTIKKLVNMSR